jgi:hypothetical protein
MIDNLVSQRQRIASLAKRTKLRTTSRLAGELSPRTFQLKMEKVLAICNTLDY